MKMLMHLSIVSSSRTGNAKVSARSVLVTHVFKPAHMFVVLKTARRKNSVTFNASSPLETALDGSSTTTPRQFAFNAAAASSAAAVAASAGPSSTSSSHVTTVSSTSAPSVMVPPPSSSHGHIGTQSEISTAITPLMASGAGAPSVPAAASTSIDSSSARLRKRPRDVTLPSPRDDRRSPDDDTGRRAASSPRSGRSPTDQSPKQKRRHTQQQLRR